MDEQKNATAITWRLELNHDRKLSGDMRHPGAGYIAIFVGSLSVGIPLMSTAAGPVGQPHSTASCHSPRWLPRCRHCQALDSPLSLRLSSTVVGTEPAGSANHHAPLPPCGCGKGDPSVIGTFRSIIYISRPVPLGQCRNRPNWQSHPAQTAISSYSINITLLNTKFTHSQWHPKQSSHPPFCRPTLPT